MADFWTDLNRHIAAYERDEREAELWDETCPEWRDESVDPEDRDVIGYGDVADPEVPVVRGYGGDHRVEVVPGAYPTGDWWK